MLAINAAVMRHANRTLLLNRIRMRPISRAELADETGLTRASVTQIVEELINEGLVIETSIIGRTRLGRRSTQLAISPSAGYVFGVSLQPAGCTVGMMDMLGNVLTRSMEVINGRAPADVLDAVAGIIRAQPESQNARIFGVGVSVPGPVDQQRGVLLNPVGMEEWTGIDVRGELLRRTGMDIYIESAANAQALEQKYFGGAGESFALVRMEDTLSVGLVIQDSLYRGAPDFTVELGQCPADPDGRQTLSMLLAGDGNADWMQMLEHPELPEAEQLMLRLSYPLASVMCIYQVPSVVLGGAVGERLAPMADKLLQRVRALLPRSMNDRAELSIAATDPARAAASPAYHPLFAQT